MMNFMQKALCKVGAHKWVVSSELCVVKTRTCECCHKKQRFEQIFDAEGVAKAGWKTVECIMEYSILEDHEIMQDEFATFSENLAFMNFGHETYIPEKNMFGEVIHIRRREVAIYLEKFIEQRLLVDEDFAAKWSVDDGDAYIGDCLFIQNYAKNNHFHRHVYNY